VADYAAQMVPTLLKALRSPTVVQALGTDIMGSTKEFYNIAVEQLCLVAMLMKVVQDLVPATVTDAFLLDRLAHALDTGPGGDMSGWPGWVVLQVAPENLAQYGATEADSVASLRAKIAAYNAAQ
jgi:hypothetical protein